VHHALFHRASTLEEQYRWHVLESSRNGGGRRKYYMLLNADDVLEGRVNIEEELSKYNNKEVAAIREEVVWMISRFGSEGEVGGGMRDAFDITMDRVMDRMKRIKGRMWC
jgi:hypothetical protein